MTTAAPSAEGAAPAEGAADRAPDTSRPPSRALPSRTRLRRLARVWRGPVWRMTAVRLTLAYMAVLAVFAVGIVLYLATNTADLLQDQVRQRIDEEVRELEQVYRGSNLRRLIRSIDRRARAPGANLYLVADREGRIIAGNVRGLDRDVLDRLGWHKEPFGYRGFDGDDEGAGKQAIARVFLLPSRLKMLVGRDVGETARFRSIIQRTVIIAVAAIGLFGLAAWYLVGRRALRRIDSVARTSRRIMAGDLSQRLQIAGTGDEFDRLAQNLNALLDRIEQLDVGLKQVSDNIAHDLRTPLARLRNRASAAIERGDRETALRGIEREADELIETFEALLMISRVEAGGRAGALSPVDLATVARDVAELFEPVAEDEGGSLVLHAPESLMISGNRELLAQALSNLVENALKHGRGSEAPHIRIVLRDARPPTLTVSDNGPGVPEAERERVQQRFARMDRSRSTDGTGLGLALVRAIAELHGARLKLADARPGRAEPGLAVTFVFPRD